MMPPALVDYLASLGASPDALDGWEIGTAQRAGQDVAFVISRGAELHFVQIAEKKALSRKNIAEYVRPIIERYGYISTRTAMSETDHRLREKLGFKHTWSDNDFMYWTLTSVPYERETR